MLDRHARRYLAAPTQRAARLLAGWGVPAPAVTVVGFAAGIGACAAAVASQWSAALVLWLANRVADGLDGPIARRRGTAGERGGYADIMADFTVYGGFVVAVAVARPEARLACAALLLAYYVSGSAFLAWSSAAERLRRERPDERSLHFVGGVAEGAETVVVYVLFCLFPHAAAPIAWAFAGAVALTALQRVVFALRSLPPPVR